jgi:hypothetical protein
MTVANSIHAELRFRGRKIAKVRNVDMQTQRATLEAGGIGDVDQEYGYGKRTTSGSATLLYKTDDPATVELMNRIFDDDEQPDELQMIIYKGSNRSISGPALISQQGLAISTGDNTQVSISFVINGKPDRMF